MNKILLALFAFSAISLSVYADTLSTTSLLASQGFTINGPSGAQIGMTASLAGDFNNDGDLDLFFSSSSTNEAYLVLGGSSATTSDSFTLSGSMSSSQGFKIVGPSGSKFGTSFAAGDFNGDGYSDLMIGAFGSDSVYVLFGCSTSDMPSRFGSSFTVSASMPTNTGFKLNGPAGSHFGISLASAQFNGDAYMDVAIGANNAAQAYLIFGCNSGVHPQRYGPSFTVSATMDWTQGVRFNGPSNFGLSVAMGDLNGDDLAELIIGGFTTSAYVLLGQTIYALASSSPPFGQSFTVGSSMTSAQGFEIKPSGSSFFGSTVAFLGDFNKDNRGDFAIGTPGTVNKAFVLFGSYDLNSRYGSSFTVSNSMSSDVGFQVIGSGGVGNYVSRAGDINGDGFDDVIIGAVDLAYVLYGCDSSTVNTRYSSSFSVAGSISAANGFQVTGPTNSDFYPLMSSVGDINKDNYDDLVFGAPGANKAYVITGYCSAGSYFLGSSCVACPTDSYCPGGRTKSTCPTGTSSPANSTSSDACSCSGGSYSTTAGGSCTSCPANSYCTGGTSISACPSGTTSSSGSSASSACVNTPSSSLNPSGSCASGTYSTTAGGSCNTCPANSYCTGGTSISTCPSGTTSPSGSKTSGSCTTGSSPSSGADSIGVMTSAMLLVGLALL